MQIKRQLWRSWPAAWPPLNPKAGELDQVGNRVWESSPFSPLFTEPKPSPNSCYYWIISTKKKSYDPAARCKHASMKCRPARLVVGQTPWTGMPNTRGGGRPGTGRTRVLTRPHRTSAPGMAAQLPNPRRRCRRADPPSAATRTRHRFPLRAVGRRCLCAWRLGPSSRRRLPAARRVLPGLRQCDCERYCLGSARLRGPACQGRLAAVGRPAAAGCFFMAPPALGEERDQPPLGLLHLHLHHVVVARFADSSTERRLPPSLSLLPHHLFAGTLQPRKKGRRKKKKEVACCPVSLRCRVPRPVSVFGAALLVRRRRRRERCALDRLVLDKGLRCIYVSLFRQLLMVFLATSALSVSVSFLLPVAFQ